MNYSQVDIKNELRKFFSDAGVLLTDKQYAEVRSKVYYYGLQYRNEFVKHFKSSCWERILKSMNRQYANEDVIRILGFGHVLTEFTISSFPIAPEYKKMVIKLGATANFIVAFFDHILDLAPSQSVILSEKELILASSKPNSLYFWIKNLFSSPPKKLILYLVPRYFWELKMLSNAANRKDILHLLNKVILLMYKAELESAVQKNNVNILTTKRKAALPFVVMGLPVWLVYCNTDRIHFIRHLIWLYRTGDFFGDLDDVVDLKEDAKYNLPNRFSNKSLDDFVTTEKIIADVMKKFERVISSNDFMTDKNFSDNNATTSFYGCIMSWLGS